jgi:hypothetical protein
MWPVFLIGAYMKGMEQFCSVRFMFAEGREMVLSKVNF